MSCKAKSARAVVDCRMPRAKKRGRQDKDRSDANLNGEDDFTQAAGSHSGRPPGALPVDSRRVEGRRERRSKHVTIVASPATATTTTSGANIAAVPSSRATRMGTPAASASAMLPANAASTSPSARSCRTSLPGWHRAPGVRQSRESASDSAPGTGCRRSRTSRPHTRITAARRGRTSARFSVHPRSSVRCPARSPPTPAAR